MNTFALALALALASALSACRPTPESSLVTVDRSRSEVAAAGVLVTAFEPSGDGFAILVDGDGVVRWNRIAPRGQRVARVEAGANDTVWLGVNDPKHEEFDGLVTHETLDGEVLSETVVPSFHHDLVVLDDSRIAVLGHTFEDRDIPGRGVLPIGSDVIRVGPQGGQLDVVFDLLHDYGIDPYWTCPHMEVSVHLEGVNEWSHTNSLVRAPDGGWLVMPRYLDAIVALDPSFAVQWQLGGVGGDIATAGPLFRHAHFSHAFDDRILVFDNGWDHVPEEDLPVARVVEIRVDPVAHSAETVWSYVEPHGDRVSYLGDAKRLPGGNTLIAWGNRGTLTEVTPDGDVVWELALDRTVGRAELWTGRLP